MVVERIRAAVERATTLSAPLRIAAGWAIAPRDGTEAGDLIETAEASVFEQKLAARSAGPSLPAELMTALWDLPDGAQQLVRLLHPQRLELEEPPSQPSPRASPATRSRSKPGSSRSPTAATR